MLTPSPPHPPPPAPSLAPPSHASPSPLPADVDGAGGFGGVPPATAYVAATVALLACVAFFCVRRRPLKAAAECCGCLLSVQVVPFRPLEEEEEAAAAASSPPKRSPPKLKRLLSTGLILNEAARPIMTAPRTPRAHPAGLPARLHSDRSASSTAPPLSSRPPRAAAASASATSAAAPRPAARRRSAAASSAA